MPDARAIAFVAPREDPARWLPALRAALPRDSIRTWPDVPDPALVDVALVTRPPAGALRAFSSLRLIQSLWMGVDALLADATLPRDVPLARLVDPGMVAAMSETVLACVLDWHRARYRYRAQQRERAWRPLPQALASDRTVGLLGLGELGRDAAAKLGALGFRVCGWSRRPKALAGIECFSGADGLRALLARSGALVCLLPLTLGTRGILNAEAFAQLPRGACIINVARGAHLSEADLAGALDSGQLAHAYLDVFSTEPLPASHPFWAHPQVTLTPHVAALTEPRTAAAVIAENVARVRRGEAALHLVDREREY